MSYEMASDLSRSQLEIIETKRFDPEGIRKNNFWVNPCSNRISDRTLKALVQLGKPLVLNNIGDCAVNLIANICTAVPTGRLSPRASTQQKASSRR
jgi:hypothetical protein